MVNKRTKFLTAVVGSLVCVAGCVSVNNTPHGPQYYADPREPFVLTLQLDSQDISAIAEQAVADMLSSAVITGQSSPVRVAVDSAEFKNLSNDPVLPDTFTSHFRATLKRAGGDRVIVINPQRGRDDGSAGNRDAQAVDYDLCLGGEVSATMLPADAYGRCSASYHIVFELYRPGTREIVWSSPPYVLKKIGYKANLGQ